MVAPAAHGYNRGNKNLGGKSCLGVQYINALPAEVRAEAGPIMMQHGLSGAFSVFPTSPNEHSGFTGFTGSASRSSFSLKRLMWQFLTHCLFKSLMYNCFLFNTLSNADSTASNSFL